LWRQCTEHCIFSAQQLICLARYICYRPYLEINDIINPIQSGFCKQRSTTDHLVRLESFIREAFIRKQHAVVVFFDLEKVYDTTWKYGILQDLKDIGLTGHLPTFIKKNFK